MQLSKGSVVMLIIVATPLTMAVSKAGRISGQEAHEIQMRTKHYSTFVSKGCSFVDEMRRNCVKQVQSTNDPLVGKELF